MISYFVKYRGSAADPAGFVDDYATHHAAILKEFTGIRTLSLHEPVDWNDTHSRFTLITPNSKTMAVELLLNTIAAIAT